MKRNESLKKKNERGNVIGTNEYSGRYRFYQPFSSLGGFSGCILKAQSCKIGCELRVTSPLALLLWCKPASWHRWELGWGFAKMLGPQMAWRCSRLVEIWLQVWEETWHPPLAAKQLLFFHYGFLQPSGFTFFHKPSKQRPFGPWK